MKRKFVAAGVALLATAFIGQAASAKTLEDVLKEKGVISEADYKEVTKVKPLNYALGKGFTFTSADEKFQLSLSGRMQFRYTFFDKDGSQDVSQWDAKRTVLTMAGYAFSKDLTYIFAIDPRQVGTQAAGVGSKILRDANINYRFIDEAQIRLGQFKVPFLRQELTSDANQQFVDRSIVVDAFKPSYDIGAALNGKIAKGLAEYTIGVFGGAGQTTGRSTNDNLFAARVAVNPFGDVAYSEADLDRSAKPLLAVGADYFRNTVKKGEPMNSTYASTGWFGGNTTVFATGQKGDIDAVSGDITFKWMGASLTGEYVFAQAERQDNGALLRAHGFYAQAGYMILPQLEAAFRYSWMDPNRDVANDQRSEQIGAISYYFAKHALKLQADVGNLHTQTGLATSTNEMQYRLQAQITF